LEILQAIQPCYNLCAARSQNDVPLDQVEGRRARV
jgi:hypothetical protein